MILRLLLLLLFIAAPLALRAAPLPDDEIIPRFYELLFREEPPTAEDERAFFDKGGSELLLQNIIRFKLKESGRPVDSETLVWDFLRENRHWFIVENSETLESMPLSVSIITLRRYKRKGTTHFEPASPPHDRKQYLVEMVGQPAGPNAYKGIRTIRFYSGESSYLAIAMTAITDQEQSLVEKIGIPPGFF